MINHKKLRIFVIFVILLLLNINVAYSITDEERDLYFETLYLAGDDSEKIKKFLDALNYVNADLSNEEELSKAILIKVNDLNVDVKEFEALKFANVNTRRDLNIDILNLTYYFLGGLILIILFYYIYKNKDKLKRKPISSREQQLKNFIKKAKKQGQNKNQIKQELIQSEWPRDLVDKYL